MESSSHKLSETSKKVIDHLLSTYERARGVVCLKVFFPNFSFCQSCLRFIDSNEELDRIWYGSKGITKGEIWFINARVTCITAYMFAIILLLRYTKHKNRREERMIWKNLWFLTTFKFRAKDRRFFKMLENSYRLINKRLPSTFYDQKF